MDRVTHSRYEHDILAIYMRFCSHEAVSPFPITAPIVRLLVQEIKHGERRRDVIDILERYRSVTSELFIDQIDQMGTIDLDHHDGFLQNWRNHVHIAQKELNESSCIRELFSAK